MTYRPSAGTDPFAMAATQAIIEQQEARQAREAESAKPTADQGVESPAPDQPAV